MELNFRNFVNYFHIFGVSVSWQFKLKTDLLQQFPIKIKL